MSKPLHIYKASAGSGKTFTLAAEYISNLINGRDEGGNSHRHQLAITFTKKATAEMKERILEFLYRIAFHTNAADGVFRAVRQKVENRIDDAELRLRAKKALSDILHNYDQFHVTTIDSFFQSLLTNLAHELNLSSGFKVDLNDTNVLGKGVDRLLQQLAPNSEILQWVSSYIESFLNEDKNWNVAQELKHLSQELLKEPYMRNEEMMSGILSNSGSIAEFRNELTRLRNSALASLEVAAKDLSAFIVESEGFERISNGARWLAPFLERFYLSKPDDMKKLAPSATILKWSSQPNELLKKSDREKESLSAWAAEVSKRLADLLLLAERKVRTVNSCDLSMRYLNPLRLLGEIANKVSEINDENNAILLARTPLLFNKMVAKEEASFVFERAGTNFHHVMIDEFQDTSFLQWHSLQNLIDGSIAHGMSCMLVGDVKQAIYRWRGGDWKALSEFKDDEMHTVTTLDSNFRSGENIVRFNNIFFRHAAKWLDQEKNTHQHEVQIASIYNKTDTEQKPQKCCGFVRICVETEAPKTRSAENSDDKSVADEPACEAFSPEADLVEQLQRVHGAGVPYEKMMILVRKTDEAGRILAYFNEREDLKHIPLVSDEAFLLESSPAVQVVIHALRCICRQDDGVARGYLERYYPAGKRESIFQELEQWGGSDFHDVPFYNLVQQLIDRFELYKQKGQSPYLYAFLDAVLQYLDDNVPSIKKFLQHWEEVLHRKSIPSAAVKGVRILTIHKSKGLDAHTIFLPYCNWDIDKMHGGDLLWIEPSEKPYSAFPVLPIPMVEAAVNSIYSKEYAEERLQRSIESLNLLYVAFTRARQNLIVSAPVRAASIYHVLKGGLAAAESISDLPTYDEQFGDLLKRSMTESIEVLEIGVPSNYECVAEISTCKDDFHNPLNVNPASEQLNYQHQNAVIKFRQSSNALAFNALLSQEEAHREGETAGAVTEAARIMGQMLHRIMERVAKREDVEKVVQQFLREGKIAHQQEAEEIAQRLTVALAHPIAQLWFDGSWRLYRECKILTPPDEKGRTECRPDRVMMRGDETVIVDYKFGQSHRDYNEQVRKYARQLYKMGRRNIKGYLWYVYAGKVEEVDLSPNLLTTTS